MTEEDIAALRDAEAGTLDDSTGSTALGEPTDIRARFVALTGRQPSEQQYWTLYALAQAGDDLTAHINSMAAEDEKNSRDMGIVEWWWRHVSGGDEVPDDQRWPLFAIQQQGQDIEPHVRAAYAGVKPPVFQSSATVMNAPIPEPMPTTPTLTRVYDGDMVNVAAPRGSVVPLLVAAAVAYALFG